MKPCMAAMRGSRPEKFRLLLQLHLRGVHFKPLIGGSQPIATESVGFGIRTDSEGQPVRNRILLALPEEEFNFVRPLLAFERFAPNTHLYEPGETAGLVHFLNAGLASILVVTGQGKTVEVGLEGNEGMLGTPGLAGMARSPHRVVVQIEGDGFRAPLKAMQQALSQNPYLQRIAFGYAIVQGMQVAQSAACNRLHGVEQRLARWLLIARDRGAQDFLHLTHEFLATMLGTDRPSVSLAAGILQKKGAIEYTRGQLHIASYEKLQQATCECYAAVQQFDLEANLGRIES